MYRFFLVAMLYSIVFGLGFFILGVRPETWRVYLFCFVCGIGLGIAEMIADWAMDDSMMHVPTDKQKQARAENMVLRSIDGLVTQLIKLGPRYSPYASMMREFRKEFANKQARMMEERRKK